MPQLHPNWRHSQKHPPLLTQLQKQPGFTLARFIVTFLLIILVFTDTFVNVGSSLPRAQAASLPQPTQSHLNLQQYLKQGRPDNAYHGPLVWNSQPENPPADTHAAKVNSPLLPSHQPAHMQPITQSLSNDVLTSVVGGKDVTLVDSHKSFEVHLPASSFDLTHAVIAIGTSKTSVPHGPFTITIKQLAGHSVGMMNVLGSYQLQIFDSQQHAVTGILLKQPISLVYHYQPVELTSLNLDAAHMVLSLPDMIAAVQNAQKTADARLVAQQVAKYTVPLTNDPTAHTLTAQLQVMPTGPADFAGDPLIQSPPTPHLASMGGNAGQSGYAYPLQVPPGPAGFAPNLALAYSSSDPNGRHDRTSPAGGLGDGWGLSLGSISTEVYPSTSASPGSWFFLSGIAGASDRLVPDTTAGFFQTEHISRLKIQLVTSSVTNKPCFNVWDKDGTYYQIGCTADSLQYYNTTSGSTNYRWDVNRIIAPNQGPGSTYKLTMVSYEQDKASDGSVRDAAIKQVTYGSGTTTNAISSVDGTVDFHYRAPSNDGAWAVAYGTNYNCTGTVPGGSTTLRCDDPVQQAGSSVAAPKVMSTLSLQNVISYVGDDSATTHAAYEYDFSYQDNVFTFPCYDPYTLVQQSCAGEHLLKQIVPKVYLKGTSHQLKPVLFGYSGTLENFYTDENHTQQGNTTFYNVQTYWQYLTNYFDSNTGIGGQISYQTAYSNTEGTPYVTDGSGNVIDDRHDPLYCTKHANDTDTTKRCSTFSLHHPDDQTWSVQVVTQIKTWGVDSTATALQPAVTSYAYKLAATGTYTSGNFCYPASQTVPGQKDCVGDTWIPASNGTQDADWQDFYHGEFHGFSQVYITSPSGNLTVASYNSTEGWKTPNSNSGNYNSGHLWKEDVYSGNSETGPLLEETVNQYTGNSGYQNSCNGKLNPVYNPCEVIMVWSKTTFYEGTTNSNAPWVEHNYSYDDYSSTAGLLAGYHNLTQEDVLSSNAGPDTTHPLYSNKSQYVTYDATISGTTYYKVNALSHSEIDDSSGHVWQCQDMTYDEGAAHQPTAGWLTTSKSYSDCTNKSGTAITTYAGYDKLGNAVAAVDGVATANSSLYTSNGCTLTTAPVYKSSSWTSGRYTACTVYDAYNAQVASSTNAFGQTSSKTYDYTQDARPTQSTDANGQHISNAYSYDVNSSTNAKAIVQVSEPGETGSYTTQSTSNSTCAASLPTAAVTPCFEMDSNTSQYGSAITRTFYDGQGRSVETLKPGPDATHTTVAFTFYNEQQHSMFQSQPFVVNARTTWLDPNGATDMNGNAPGGTATYLDALGRTIAVKDAIFNAGQSTGISCPSLGSNATTCTLHGLGSVGGSDTNVYDTTTNVDANGHVDVTYDDALGRTRYYQSESGRYGGTLTVNALKTVQYNVLNKPTSMVVTDEAPLSGQSVTSVTTTLQYDDLGRVTVMNDPDKGTHTYTYDANGNIVKDVSGTRTIGTSYDLLGRVGCIQDAQVTIDAHGGCTSGTNHFVINTYDADPGGVTWGGTNYAVGHLTQSYAINYFSSPDNTQGKVTENFQYDQRGRQITQRLNITATGGTLVFPTFPQYQEALSYNDADQATMTQTTVGGSTGYTFTQSYDSTSGVLNGLSNTSTGNQSLAALSYNAQDQLSTLLLKSTTGTNLAQVAYTYDGNLRPTNASATWQSGSGQSGTIFSEGTSYDATSNVLSQVMQQAAVPGQSNSGGTEAQNFCYDEQNRLVWASNSGTVPAAGNGTCGNLNFQSTLGGAYANSYSYTHLGQVWEAPLNGNGTQEQYLYCNSSQPHQVTALAPDSGSPPTCSNMGTPDYQASYDNWGNMSSRTTSGSTGALSFDGLDHLMRWNASFGSTNNEEWYMYDGTGNRVLRRYINSSGTTLVTYPFGLEEHTYGSSGTDQGRQLLL